MPTPDLIQGVPLPVYDDPAAIPDDLANIFYALLQRGIPRFSTTAQRDAAYPSPVDGQHCWVTAENAVYVRSGGAWRRQWGAEDTYTTTVPAGFVTTASGWTVNVVGFSMANRVISAMMQITRTGEAITSGPTGDVANVTIGTIAAGYRPANSTPLGATAAGVLTGIYINDAGTLALASMLPNTTWENSASRDLGGIWLRS